MPKMQTLVFLFFCLCAGCFAGLAVIYYDTVFRKPNEMVQRVKSEMNRLEQAIVLHKQMNGRYPAFLLEMTESGLHRAVLKDMSFVIDPWGNPYCYDPNQLHPKTGLPLIWTEGPPGKKTQTRITNWD